MMQLPPLKASYYTLGCKLNFAETSTLGRTLAREGVERAKPGETPDLVVVNTCSVTETADKKSRQLLRRLRKQWPDATIVATGCYAQLRPAEVAESTGADIVLGNDEKLRIDKFVRQWTANHAHIEAVSAYADIHEFRHACERGDRTRYFLKVQDGCDYFCSYCTIPRARGRSRSPQIGELVEMARNVAAEGGREIVLTGVNIGDFGKPRGDSFLQLVKALDEVQGIERYRISSIEPDLLTPEIIEYVATSRAFMPHFHIPLQSGSDAVLKMMRRHYDTALFADRIQMVKRLIPRAFIGVDVIAGARGETPEEWQKSLSFLQSLPLTKLHVFPYSERPGTVALSLQGYVEPAERHRRVGVLTDMSDRWLADFTASAVGATMPVLWEAPGRGKPMHGFTDNYIRVTAPHRPELVNRVTPARLTGIDPNDPFTALAEPLT